MKKFILFLLLIIAAGVILKNQPISQTLPTPTPATDKEVITSTPTIIADKLQIPWSLVFLPDKSLLFTERPGRLRLISPEGRLLNDPIAIIKDVKSIGEGGLLGIAIHPNFEINHYLFLYYTYGGNENKTLNKVVRYVLQNNKLSEEKVIVSDIPGNSNHNGGRLKFGPDGFLYVTTGDSQNPSLSQDKSSLAGKILRVTADGETATGNPFGNATYSYGHRNPQGLAWDDQGRLWSTEHGPSTKDELNLIELGKNYGWPEITGNQTGAGVVSPVINSGSSTWAPSGLSYAKPYLYFAGLRSNTLFSYNTETKSLTPFLKGDYGRLRDVVLGPNGLLYVATSNMDGRSLTKLDGDKIIVLDPANLK